MVDAVCREIKQKRRRSVAYKLFWLEIFPAPPVIRVNKDEESQLTLLDEDEVESLRVWFTCLATGLINCYLTEQYRQDDSIFFQYFLHKKINLLRST